MTAEKRFAIHEAGHAVTAIALGFEDVRVVIPPPQRPGMRLSGTDYLTPADVRAAAPRIAVVAMAGMAASVIAGDPDPHEVARIDERKVAMLALALDLDPAVAANAWYQEALELVRDRWRYVAAVGWVLANLRPKLGADELAAIMKAVDEDGSRALAAGIIGNPAVQKMDLVRIEDPKTGIFQNFVLDTIHTEMDERGYFGTVSLVRAGVANDEITEPDPPPSDGDATEDAGHYMEIDFYSEGDAGPLTTSGSSAHFAPDGHTYHYHIEVDTDANTYSPTGRLYATAAPFFGDPNFVVLDGTLQGGGESVVYDGTFGDTSFSSGTYYFCLPVSAGPHEPGHFAHAFGYIDQTS